MGHGLPAPSTARRVRVGSVSGPSLKHAATGKTRFVTLRWRKADSSPRSHSYERVCRVLRKGDPGTSGVPIKLWSSREMAIGCAPSPRPRTRRDRDFESRLLRQKIRNFRH